MNCLNRWDFFRAQESVHGRPQLKGQILVQEKLSVNRRWHHQHTQLFYSLPAAFGRACVSRPPLPTTRTPYHCVLGCFLLCPSPSPLRALLLPSLSLRLHRSHLHLCPPPSAAFVSPARPCPPSLLLPTLFVPTSALCLRRLRAPPLCYAHAALCPTSARLCPSPASPPPPSWPFDCISFRKESFVSVAMAFGGEEAKRRK